MTDRGRTQNQDWDLDYDNSNYDPQNPDDSSSGYVNLDHCRLYITNIPRALNDDGLAAAFSKYGTLVECFVSQDPNRRYGLVSYETPGEAKAAMMKLNRTEPLNLYVNIAHKSKAKRTDNLGCRGGNSSGARYRDDRGFRDDGSVGNRSNNNRRQDFMANGDSMDDLVGDHGILNSSLEPDVNLELEQLKLQQLKLQEEQLLCKHRMLLLRQTERKPSSSTRCIMPDGRIVVRSVDQGENDTDNYGTGAGDATKIPGLQSCAICVGCGERAESFCSGCRVTPYCSAACQRRDWFSRHRKVCHNLKRQSGDAVPSKPEPEPEPVIPAPAALRRPRSPDSGRGNPTSDRMPPRRFGPPGHATAPTPVAAAARGGNRNSHGGQQSDRGRPNRSFEGDNDASNARSNDRNRDRNDRNRNDRDRNQDNRNNGYGRSRNQDGGNRQFSRPSGGADNRAPEQDEDWGPASAKPQEAKPQATPSATKASELAATPKPALAEAAPVPRASARPIATVADVAPLPARKLTPANCVTELLSPDEVFLLAVDAGGESCRAGAGWVCSSGFPSGPHADNYGLLIEPLSEACEAAEAVQPRPGDLFAYLDPSEGAWYRARCLGAGLAALLDASRLVQFTSQDRCSRLPKQFADIPEYCCLLDSNKVKLTDTLECTVVSKSGGQLTVSLATASGPVGTATVRRWLPEVDAPPARAPAALAKLREPEPQPAPVEAAPVPRASARPIATVADVAPLPARKLTPANCVTELLSPDEVFLLAVDAGGESCRAGAGWVCSSGFPSGPHADNYGLLIEPLSEACEAAEVIQPRPGDLFAYLDPSEGAWYRARCLGAGLAALLDASRLVQFTSQDRCSRLPKQFADIPEYCCLLESNKVKLTDTLECTVISKSGGQLTVSLATASGPVGTATVRRWLPEVDAPPAAAAARAPASTELPQVPRPPVTNNSFVRLVDATEPTRVFVKPAAVGKMQEYDQVVYDVQQYAADPAVPRLRELPAKGQTVIARSTDDVHYRALVMRVSSKLKRCLLEYMETGKVAIEDNLENMCECPPALDVSARPPLTSMVTLQIKPKAFTDPALAYLDTLKEGHEMKLTILSGASSGPAGTPVRLTVLKSGEDVNRKAEALSTPQWLQHLERGGDVLEIESVHFSDIEYVDPTSGELDILDCSLLQSGCVYGHSRQAPHAQRAFALSAMLEEYCNSALAKDPYLPKLEELCIAKCPKSNQWLRAVVVDQPGGPGAPSAELQFFDRGDMAAVPVRALRKMMPEFVRGVPAAVCSIEIKDFPPNPTPEQLERAKRHMQIKDGAGVLTVTRCTRQQLGEYVVEAPDLIRALQ